MHPAANAAGANNAAAPSGGLGAGLFGGGVPLAVNAEPEAATDHEEQEAGAEPENTDDAFTRAE